MPELTPEMLAQIREFEENYEPPPEPSAPAIPITPALKQAVDDFKADLESELEEVPPLSIAALQTSRKSQKKARKARDKLAASAPYGSTTDIGSLPITVADDVPKNTMFAVDSHGNRIFRINTKTFTIEIVAPEGEHAENS